MSKAFSYQDLCRWGRGGALRTFSPHPATHDETKTPGADKVNAKPKSNLRMHLPKQNKKNPFQSLNFRKVTETIIVLRLLSSTQNQH